MTTEKPFPEAEWEQLYWYRAKAQALYASDDVEFDDVPRISKTEEGAWVQAWVWVPSPRKEKGDE